jgi:glycosyltransferase involved in cell wall biosynthesis
MGKKNKNKTTKIFPLVSVCTPTFNRRPFIPYLIKCFESQDYPKDKIEWIIVDDGTDKIEDLVKHIPQVKYFALNEKISLGKKRNLMHEKCNGEYIVYMDDDDFYPPQRVSHAVNMLETHPSALCAGSSEIYIYFKHIEKMYQFGPYGERHATAGTFAFKKKLLNNTRYNDDAALAEEKAFLNNYTIPFVQLDPLKVILVFSHEHNTFDKKTLLENKDEKYCKESTRTIDHFIKDEELKNFYHNEMHNVLKEYSPGEPCNKPDVLEQIKTLKEQRSKIIEENKNNSQICINKNGQDIVLTNEQIVNVLQQQQNEIERLTKELQIKNKLLDYYTNKGEDLI